MEAQYELRVVGTQRLAGVLVHGTNQLELEYPHIARWTPRPVTATGMSPENGRRKSRATLTTRSRLSLHDALALLKRKLDDTRLPDEVNAAEWAYGTSLTGSAAKGIPLLFVHDWPGGLLEVTKSPRVAWSEGVLEKGFHAMRYAELFNKLMASLSYSEYVTQSGDCGHVYLIPSFTARERRFAAHTENFFKNGRGYSAEQATKPQTIGFSLLLLGWICEKLVTWTNCSRGSRFIGSRAWGPAASIRIYYELALAGQVVSFPKTTVPVGLSYFPKDLVQFSRIWLRAQAKIVFESEHEVGWHFAASE
ncbi:alpha/beta-hydrolase [Lactarius psammicola]|nr:alpha/beta-hydrolase [Lactarius psammicola]